MAYEPERPAADDEENAAPKPGSAILAAALSYASRGIPVFPCNPKDKRPLTEHGFKDATTDIEQVRRWWTEHPENMIGIPTGKRTGYLVVDIDPRHGGDSSLTRLMEKNGITTHLGHIVKTGSGGQHLYYRYDPRFTIGKGDGELQGIDHRGEGGYVIVPPSTHPSGGFYSGEVPDPDSLATIPDWLANAIIGEMKRTKIDTSLKGEPIKEGGRNDYLFRLGAKLRAQDWEYDDILSHLLLVNAGRCEPPLPETEVAVLAKQAASYEKGNEATRAIEKVKKRFAKKSPETPEEINAAIARAEKRMEQDSTVVLDVREDNTLVLDVREKTELPNLSADEVDEFSSTQLEVQYSDAGNAEYFVKKYGANLRYVTETNRWLWWDGKRWKEDASKKYILKLVERAMRERIIELVASGKNIEKKEMSLANSALSERKLNAALDLAATRVPISYYSLNAKPSLLNVQNGTVDLRTGTMKAHDPNDLLTQMAEASYVPEAGCERFKKFWAEVLPDVDPEYLRLWFGYCLTGENREKKMHIWEGRRGNNGKSTVKNLFLYALGDYAIEVSVSVFIGKNRDYKNDDLVGLKDVRLIFGGEPEDGAILNSSLIKRITGMDKIRCRPLHSNEWVNYEPTFKPVILTNHELRVYDTDEAFWRRPAIVRFEKSFEGKEDDKSLIDKLKQEADGILAWMVSGAVEWYKRGLPTDECIKKETAIYRERQDVLGDFLRSYKDGELPSMGVPLPTPRWPVSSNILRRYYNSWSDEEGYKRLSKARFKEEMERQGYVSKHTEHGTFWEPSEQKQTSDNKKQQPMAADNPDDTQMSKSVPSIHVEGEKLTIPDEPNDIKPTYSSHVGKISNLSSDIVIVSQPRTDVEVQKSTKRTFKKVVAGDDG